MNNYKFFEKYFDEIYQLNIPIITLYKVDKYNNSLKIDYSLLLYSINNLFYKQFSILFLNNIFFLSLSFNSFFFKKKYLLIFFKFFKNLF